MKRYALVKGADGGRVAAYLPSNYSLEGTTSQGVMIGGRDQRGWTLEVVLARLGSGLLTGEEIDLSHPAMRDIPAFPGRRVGPGNSQGGEKAMTNTELIRLLERTAGALDEECAWLVDVDFDDRGRERTRVAPDDREYFDSLVEQVQALRGLVKLIQARQPEEVIK